MQPWNDVIWPTNIKLKLLAVLKLSAVLYTRPAIAGRSYNANTANISKV